VSRKKSGALSDKSRKSAWQCIQEDAKLSGSFMREVDPTRKGPGGKPKYKYFHNGRLIAGSVSSYLMNVCGDSDAAVEARRYAGTGSGD
jgi:hypothetical protein